MSARFRSSIRLLCFGLCLAVAGCATNTPLLPPGTSLVVNAPQTALYKYGPAQSFGADFTLNYGTKVTLIERSIGYYRVMTDKGISGYVASEDLDIVAPEPLKKLERSSTETKRRTYSGPIKRSDVQPIPGDPLFDIDDVPLPMPKPPEAKPDEKAPKGPKFRVNPTPKPPPAPAEKKEPDGNAE
ncbi:MAG: SH3 domain-containing protein [Chthoniobacteraceae bacterium]